MASSTTGNEIEKNRPISPKTGSLRLVACTPLRRKDYAY